MIRSAAAGCDWLACDPCDGCARERGLGGIPLFPLAFAAAPSQAAPEATAPARQPSGVAPSPCSACRYDESGYCGALLRSVGQAVGDWLRRPAGDCPGLTTRITK